MGKIIKIYPRPGHDQNPLCTACEGERHNQRIVGMRIMEKLQQNKKNMNAWTDGKILDPNNGKVYNCNIQLIENNKKLQVRGYLLGLPLFGRSQNLGESRKYFKLFNNLDFLWLDKLYSSPLYLF